jgi:prevent-host-death family protein
MNVATLPVEVGIRDLKNGLSRYIDQVREGGEVIVTDRGQPVARLSAIDRPTSRLSELVMSGLVRPPNRTKQHRPVHRIDASGSVSDLVAEQRR